MQWLKSFVVWIIGLFIHETVQEIKDEIEKPNIIQDAQTPKSIAADVRRQLDEQLRDKSNNN